MKLKMKWNVWNVTCGHWVYRTSSQTKKAAERRIRADLKKYSWNTDKFEVRKMEKRSNDQ